MSKKIEGVAREPRGSQGRDNRRGTRYWNHWDAMRMGGRYEKIAWVGDEGRSTVRYEGDICSLL
jgi:hypothetical protein